MIGVLARLSKHAQVRLFDAVMTSRGDMPEVIKRMPGTGIPFNYTCFSLGKYGWYSDKELGYRYVTQHPETGESWPPFPPELDHIIRHVRDMLVAKGETDAEAFQPDSALCNVYQVGQSLGVHIDRTEKNRKAPIVSISLGYSAQFVYGATRSCGQQLVLTSGQVLVMSGSYRNWWHGIPKVIPAVNDLNINYRLNITIRQNETPTGL